MNKSSRNLLFGKLAERPYAALESAALLCKHRGHDRIGLEHWLQALLDQPNNDVGVALAHFNVDPGRLNADVTDALTHVPGRWGNVTGFSPVVDEAVRDGAVVAESLAADGIRSGHLLLAALESASLRGELMRISVEFEGIDAARLRREFDSILDRSAEAPLRKETTARSTEDVDGGAAGNGLLPPARSGALEKFTQDLTAAAREGKLEPVVGRELEIARAIDVLTRKTKNNPILVGDPGVGKTAVVEGLAQKIVAGHVPPQLKDVRLLSLDLGLLLAGAGAKGEFEARLRQVIDEVRDAPQPIVLFIDEAHQLVGAGGQKGQGDAANLLKPALARGQLRTVAATTHAEYKEFFETDAALSRRFERLVVDEPDDAMACVIVRSAARAFERHHQVVVLDEAVEAAVKLSRRYIPSRHLPDKAVGLLDTACARVALSLHAPPTRLSQTHAAAEAITANVEALKKEQADGANHAKRLAELDERLTATKAEAAALEIRWATECEIVRELAAADLTARPAIKAKLAEFQGETPLVLAAADAQAVAAVVSDWTGVPAGRMVKDELRAVQNLATTLADRVLGQDAALQVIAQRLKASRTPGLTDPTKPVAVFMLAGPSGVGKTETAKAVADLLFGGENNLIVINMSEYQEAHTVALLKGAPPGYVGYGKGGVLTEAVRRRPYSVVLLDEVEKAHKDVHELFFQVFDAGRLDDSEGRTIDFRNTVILLTSNVGTELIDSAWQDEAEPPDAAQLTQALHHEMLGTFPAALLGRLEILPYRPLGRDLLKRVVKHQLARLAKRVSEAQGIPFEYGDDVIDHITTLCDEPASGARKIASVMNQQLLPPISNEYLNRVAEGKTMQGIRVTAQDGRLSIQFD